MELIVTHSGADFDAVASLLAAKKIYPKAVPVLPASVDRDVKEYIQKNPFVVDFVRENQIDFSKVRKLVIVDTRLARRIGEAKKALKNNGLIIHLYDHHPRAKGDLSGSIDVGCEYGSTTTILTKLIMRKRLKLSPSEATLLALGIYEDTGCFTYPSTTASDMEAASFLVKNGADVNLVSDYVQRELTRDQVKLLNKLMRLEKRLTINGKEIVLIRMRSSGYIPDLNPTLRKLRDIESLDTIFVLLETKDRVRIVARSRTKAVDVSKITQVFGGGGHATAASAVVKSMDSQKVEEKLLEILRKKIRTDSVIENRNIARLLYENFPASLVGLLKTMGKISHKMNFPAYLVGGSVRDLILGVRNLDIDIVVEGNGIAVARQLKRKLQGKALLHRRFGTAVLSLPGVPRIDIASARKETYEFPAALPKVQSGSLQEDLFRRDFTINAMAISLSPNNFGALVDFYNGWEDLKKKTIRVLHPKSFIDDPTRIFRALRFSARYGFRLHPRTEKLLQEALEKGFLHHLSKERIRDEIISILNEPTAEGAIREMARVGVLKAIHPGIKFDRQVQQDLKSARRVIAKFTLKMRGETFKKWLVYFLILVHRLNREETENLCNKLRFTREERTRILEGKDKTRELLKTLRRKDLKRSEIYRTMKGLSCEALLFAVVKGRSRLIEQRVFLFWCKLRNVKIQLTGGELKEMGYREGPLFRKILEDLLLAKLDGKVRGEIAERKFVIDNYPLH